MNAEEVKTLRFSQTSNMQMLRTAVRLIDAGDKREASALLTDLVDKIQCEILPSKGLSFLVFAIALLHHLDQKSSDQANLYLREYSVPQIELFNLLAIGVPQVYGAGLIANEMICDHMIGTEQLAILDIGVGTGRQIVSLMQKMKEKKLCPKQFLVIGIDPSQDSLETARNAIALASNEFQLPVEFRPILTLIEDLSPSHWNELKDLPGKLIVNGSFALHHIRKSQIQPEIRDAVLKKLRTLNPAAIVLSEPNSDHFTSNFLERFENCWEHFNTTFQVIDELDLTTDQKDKIKVSFFGREIEDILNIDETKRAELHEPTQSWVSRLTRAGFSVSLEKETLSKIPPKIGNIEVIHHQDHAGLDFMGNTLVSVFCALPLPTYFE